MSAAIGPGDFVECVDNGVGPAGLPAPELVLGAVYQVDAIVENDDRTIGVYLAGRPHPMDGLVFATARGPVMIRGYNSDRFRPVYRPKQGIIDQLKAPPVRSKVPA